MGDTIPKRILLTWKTRTPPQIWQETVDEIHRLMPDWEVVITSDQDNDDFVRTNYPEFLEQYRALPYPIMKADLIRYLQLHKYGGFYHDLDICPVKSYQVILDWITMHPSGKVYLVPTPQGGITNSFMVSRPGCDFWYGLTEAVFKAEAGDRPFWSNVTKSIYVLNVTGPALLTRFADSHREGVVTFPMHLVNPYNMVEATYHWKEIKERDPEHFKPSASVRPLPGSSWVDNWESAIALTYMGNRTLFILLVIATIIALVVAAILIVFGVRCATGSYRFSSPLFGRSSKM